MVYFTSDNHFNHSNMLAFCPIRQELLPDYMRQLTTEEIVADEEATQIVNEEMIRRWNARVSPEDTVYHLGDFAMGDRRLIPGILSRLNGTVILIAGNHDNKRSDKYFAKVIRTPLVIELEGNTVELVHNPRHSLGTGDFTFCGHVHDLWSDMLRGTILPEYRTRHRVEKEWMAPAHIYNVGVDVRDFTPRTMAELLDPLA